MRFSLIFATFLALSNLAYSQILNMGVPDAFQAGYAANLKAGDSSLVLSNSGTSCLAGGSDCPLCVNTYVFDTSQEMIECCACTVTANGLLTIPARNSLISNTLTPAVPNSILITLVATIDPVCDPASVTAAQLAPGMVAWGTTLEPASASGKTYATVPVRYSRDPLSADELAALTSDCSYIFKLGSGSGVCKCGQGD